LIASRCTITTSFLTVRTGTQSWPAGVRLNEPESRPPPRLIAPAGVSESARARSEGATGCECESTFNAAAAIRKRAAAANGLRYTTRTPRARALFRCVIHDEERKNVHYPRVVAAAPSSIVRPLQPPPRCASRRRALFSAGPRRISRRLARETGDCESRVSSPIHRARSIVG